MHKILSTLIGTALLLVFAVGSLHAVHLVNPAGKVVTISYGKTFRIVYNQSSGLYNIYSGQEAIISAAYAEVKNGEQRLLTTDYSRISYKVEPLKDQFGKGSKYIFTLIKAGLPQLQQLFYVYPSLPYFFTEVVLKGAGVKSNYMSPITANKVNLYAKGDNRNLFVPFDNDTFIRYDAKSTAASLTNTSSEVGAFYDNTSRKGLIVGSVEHMVWKTGVTSSGQADQLNELKVFGGYTEQSVTRDQIPHGSISGSVVRSPKVFVGYFKDWRTGLETYGKVNRLSEKPYIFNWTKPVPFG